MKILIFLPINYILFNDKAQAGVLLKDEVFPCHPIIQGKPQTSDHQDLSQYQNTDKGDLLNRHHPTY